MSKLQRLYLCIGDELFERGDLENALSYYLKSYDEGSSPKALARIQEHYLLPQEANFEKYYELQILPSIIADAKLMLFLWRIEDMLCLTESRRHFAVFLTLILIWTREKEPSKAF